jgi:hypothetical protein
MGFKLEQLNLGPLKLDFTDTKQRREQAKKSKDLLSKLGLDAIRMAQEQTKIEQQESDLGKGIFGRDPINKTYKYDNVARPDLDDSLRDTIREEAGQLKPEFRLPVEQGLQSAEKLDSALQYKTDIVNKNLLDMQNNPALASQVNNIISSDLSDMDKVNNLYKLYNANKYITKEDTSQTKNYNDQVGFLTNNKTFSTFNKVIGQRNQFQPSILEGLIPGQQGSDIASLLAKGQSAKSYVNYGVYNFNIDEVKKDVKAAGINETLVEKNKTYMDSEAKILATEEGGQEMVFDQLNNSAFVTEYLRTEFDSDYSFEDAVNNIADYILIESSKRGVDLTLPDADGMTREKAVSLARAKLTEAGAYIDASMNNAYKRYRTETKDTKITQDEFYATARKQLEDMYTTGQGYVKSKRAAQNIANDQTLRNYGTQYGNLTSKFEELVSGFAPEGLEQAFDEIFVEKFGYSYSEAFEKILLEGDASSVMNFVETAGKTLGLEGKQLTSFVKELSEDPDMTTFLVGRNTIKTQVMGKIKPLPSGLEDTYGGYHRLNNQGHFSDDENIFNTIRNELYGTEKNKMIEGLYGSEDQSIKSLISALEDTIQEKRQGLDEGLMIGGGEIDLETTEAQEELAALASSMDVDLTDTDTISQMASVISATLPTLQANNIDLSTFLDKLLENNKVPGEELNRYKNAIVKEISFV